MLPRVLRAGWPVAVMLTLSGLLLAVAPARTSAAKLAGSPCAGWSTERVPSTGSRPDALHGVAVTSARNACAVSIYRSSGPYWTSRILHWNGRSWFLSQLPSRMAPN